MSYIWIYILISLHSFWDITYIQEMIRLLIWRLRGLSFVFWIIEVCFQIEQMTFFGLQSKRKFCKWLISLVAFLGAINFLFFFICIYTLTNLIKVNILYVLNISYTIILVNKINKLVFGHSWRIPDRKVTSINSFKKIKYYNFSPVTSHSLSTHFTSYERSHKFTTKVFILFFYLMLSFPF